jgi:hypothetical protein
MNILASPLVFMVLIWCSSHKSELHAASLSRFLGTFDTPVSISQRNDRVICNVNSYSQQQHTTSRLRIRGGHGFGRPWGGISCEEAEEGETIPIRNHPRPGLDHAPWVEAYRQAYIELREHNRSQLLAQQSAGESAPNVPISWQAKLADTRNPPQEMTQTWEEYWMQVESIEYGQVWINLRLMSGKASSLRNASNLEISEDSLTRRLERR